MLWSSSCNLTWRWWVHGRLVAVPGQAEELQAQPQRATGWWYRQHRLGMSIWAKWLLLRIVLRESASWSEGNAGRDNNWCVYNATYQGIIFSVKPHTSKHVFS